MRRARQALSDALRCSFSLNLECGDHELECLEFVIGIIAEFSRNRHAARGCRSERSVVTRTTIEARRAAWHGTLLHGGCASCSCSSLIPPSDILRRQHGIQRLFEGSRSNPTHRRCGVPIVRCLMLRAAASHRTHRTRCPAAIRRHGESADAQ